MAPRIPLDKVASAIVVYSLSNRLSGLEILKTPQFPSKLKTCCKNFKLLARNWMREKWRSAPSTTTAFTETWTKSKFKYIFTCLAACSEMQSRLHVQKRPPVDPRFSLIYSFKGWVFQDPFSFVFSSFCLLRFFHRIVLACTRVVFARTNTNVFSYW